MKAHTLVLFLLLSTLFLSSLGKKLSKKDKKTLKLFKSLSKKAQSLQTTLVGLVSRLEATEDVAMMSSAPLSWKSKGGVALSNVPAGGGAS